MHPTSSRNLIVLFEDNHLIAVVKHAGEPVQPEEGKPVSLEERVKNYIKVSKQKPGAVFLGVIHRLDMPVSGIVLFAKTSKALTRMNEAFRERKTAKIYTARVCGAPAHVSGKLVHYLVRHDDKRITRVHPKEVSGSVRAELEYTLLKKENGFSLLEIHLLTGRKHQIRAQLSSMGCPIEGDVKYGAPEALAGGAISLMATRLEFPHPVTKETIVVETPFTR